MSKATTTEKAVQQATDDAMKATMTGNAKKLLELQAQLSKIQDEAAEITAKEVLQILRHAEKDAETSKAEELPTPNSNYLTARMASAMFMALRDELVSAHMRVESVQQDRLILEDRKATGAFRSDVERAAAERSLAYYESLEERLEEVISLISDVVKVYNDACAAQFREDEERQQDVPPDQRTYVNMPSLRWVSNADKQAHPDDWEERNDIERMKQQAKFWLNFNSTLGSTSASQ